MGGKGSWSDGHIPTHRRMSAAEQAALLLSHTDASTAVSIAMKHAHVSRSQLATYAPSQYDLPSAADLKARAEFWNEVTEHLKHPTQPRGLDT